MKKIYVSYDFMGNPLVKAQMEQRTSDPTTDLFPSRVYWNTTTGKMRLYNGTSWENVNGSDTVTSSTVALVVDQSTPGTTALSIALADGTNPGLMPSAMFTDLNNATPALVNDAIVKRSASGTFKATDPVDNDDVATKGYIGTIIASGMTIIGDLDCSTEPNYPAASAGDTYIVSASGKIGGANGTVVTKGDMVICTTTSAGGTESAVGTSYSIQERNLNTATTTQEGTVRFGTSTEVNNGTATDLVPSLADVVTMIGTNSNGYSSTIPTSTSSVAITHNFNAHAIAQVYDAATGGKLISCDITETSLNTITLDFAPATTGTFLVNVAKGGA